MTRQELMEYRKQMLDELSKKMHLFDNPEDDIFYYHCSEDRIVLSHALFWVMTQNIKGKIAKEKYFLLLRQYQEEMLTAWLTESEEFPDLLHYCNVVYNSLPIILRGIYDLRADKAARKLSAITVVAGGYGGDMSEDLCYDLLDDIDFCYNKVKCRKIEKKLSTLNKLVENEQMAMMGYLH